MIRKNVAGQSRKVTKKHLLANAAQDTIVSSKRNIGNDYLQKLKKDVNFYAYNQNPNFDRDFVDVVNLSLESALHRDFQYLDAIVNFAFPLFVNQYAIYRVDGRTVGYLSWGWFSPETEAQYFDPEVIPADPDIIVSGGNGWIIDVIAPYGHVRETVKHATKTAKSVGVNPAKFKFQRNYVSKASRKNTWVHR